MTDRRTFLTSLLALPVVARFLPLKKDVWELRYTWFDPATGAETPLRENLRTWINERTEGMVTREWASCNGSMFRLHREGAELRLLELGQVYEPSTRPNNWRQLEAAEDAEIDRLRSRIRDRRWFS